MAPRFRFGFFALCQDGERVLLPRRRYSGWWNLPGGGMERGETVEEAAAREVREETGLEVGVERLVGVYSKPQAEEVVLTVACRVLGGELGVSDESTEFRWCRADDLPDPVLPKHAERVADWAEGRPGAVLKAQRAPSLRASGAEAQLPGI